MSTTLVEGYAGTVTVRVVEFVLEDTMLFTAACTKPNLHTTSVGEDTSAKFFIVTCITLPPDILSMPGAEVISTAVSMYVNTPVTD